MAGEWDVVSVAPVEQTADPLPAAGEWDVVGVAELDPGDRVRLKMDKLDRSIGTIASDIAVKAASGANAMVGNMGTLYGLATGDMDNPVSEQAKSGQAYWEKQVSPQLKAQEAERKAAIDAADGEWAKAGTAIWETLKNPALLSSSLAEQAAQLVPMAGAGKLVGVAAKALGAGAATAGTAAVAGGVGAGAAMQGADTGGDAYDRLMALPDPAWVQNQDVQALMAQGVPFSEAKQRVATSLSRDSAALAAIASGALNLIPGARVLEKTLAGVPSAGGMAGRAVSGLVGEGLQEGLEESTGMAAQNRAVQNVDPNQPIMQGVGEAGGMGAVVGGPMGGVAGLAGQQQPNQGTVPPNVGNEPTVEDLTGEPLSTPSTSEVQVDSLQGIPQPDGSTLVPGTESTLSPADRRIREIRDAVNAGRPVPPGPRGQAQEVPVEDVELAPPPPESELSAATADPNEQAPDVDVEEIEGIEAAPASAIEPWQMTREEFADEAAFQGVNAATDESNPSYWFTDQSEEARTFAEGERGDGKQKKRVEPRIDIAYKSDLGAEWKDSERPTGSRHAYTGAKKNRPVRASVPLSAASDPHRHLVEQAIKDGKEVPANVLAQYPDLVPPPAMAVDSEGNAQPQAQAEQARRAFTQKERLQYEQMTKRAAKLEAQGDTEGAIAIRRELAGYTQPEGDNARADRSRAERLPPNWTDNRLARSQYRYGLRQMADSIEKGGGIAYKQDENGTITGRTPSLNPAWFQSMQQNPDYKMSVAEVQKAVEKALAGKKLGVREARVVGVMLDQQRGERGEQVDYAKGQLEAARKFRKTAAEAIGITDEDVERAGELFNEREYRADWDGPTRSLYELADEAKAADPVAAQAILESSADDSTVARQLAEVIHGRTQRVQETNPGETQAGRETQAPSATQVAEEARSRDTEDGAITSYSAADLAAREQQKKDADKARQQSEQRAQADDQRGSFTLAGSDREADQAASAGQQDLLSGDSGKILGYDFEDIQRAQQGGRLSKTIDTSKPATTDENLDRDIALLEKHGKDGLEKMGYAGVLDRLNRAGLLEAKPKSGARAQLEAKVKKAKPAPLYASRPVTNAADIIAWAKEQGFTSTLSPDDLHVTVAYSRDPVDGTSVKTTAKKLSTNGGKRSVEKLGDEGAVVLKFENADMQKRWQHYRDAGASWDYDSYMPHVTITYDGGSVDLSKVKPYDGPIELGEEKQEPLNLDKADDYKETEKPLSGAAAQLKAKSKKPEGKFARRVTSTDAFKQWFGGSKVVDKDGEPLVVYHGTSSSFDVFDKSWTELSPRSDQSGLGFFFTEEKQLADHYAGRRTGANVVPVYLSISNPYVAENRQDSVWQKATNSRSDAKRVRSELEAKGYDGFITPDDEYVAFSPTQIKSATGNRGTFDPNNPDIRYAARQSRDAHRWTRVTDTPNGPLFQGNGFTLFPAYPYPNVWKTTGYIILDENGQRVGKVTLRTDNGQVTDLYWINAYEQGSGMGRRVMAGITASNDGPIAIHSVLPTARKFWDKIGAYDYVGEEKPDATLDWEAYQRATQGRDGLARDEGRAAQSQSRNASAPRQGLTPESVQTYLETKVGPKVVKRLLDSGRLKILASNSTELPADVKSAIGEGDMVFGYTENGVTYLIADNLNDKGAATKTSEDAYAILLHETGVHYGMPAMLGDKLFSSVIAEAKAATGKLGEAWAVARKMVPRGTNPAHVDEETLAWMVTDRANHELSLVKRVLAKIRAWLVSKGFTRAMSVDALVELARGAAARAGGRTQSRFARRMSEMFYSHALKAIEGAKQAKATGEQWLAELRKSGTKQEEIEWLGLDELLADAKSVTRDELAAHVRANQVEVTEVAKGGQAVTDAQALKVKHHLIDHAGMTDFEAWHLVSRARTGDEDAIGEIEQAVAPGTYDDLMKPFHEVPSTRYSNYQTPGGENYRELLLTLPVVDRSGERAAITARMREAAKAENDAEFDRLRAEKEAMADDPKYHNGHFDEPNILAHIRFNERTDADGKRVLFVEEVQSDWHQAGRKQGYKDLALKRRLDEKSNRGESLTSDEMDAYNDNVNDAVPNAPFKQSWPLLAMKRVIRWAAENGFDRVAWTTGEMQAERYDLSKQVRSIDVVPRTDARTNEKTKSVRIELINGNPFDLGVDKDGMVDNGEYKGKNLSDVVGKEMADKIMSAERATFSGDDLKIGGEGMKGFYDKILPNEVNKYIKKWGGRVGQANIEGDTYAGRKKYEGPNYSLEEARKMLKNFRTNEEQDLVLQMTGVITLMKTGKSFQYAIEEVGSFHLAVEVGGKLNVDPKIMSVHGFDLTDAMRDAAMQGQPMFARRAADDIATAVDSPAIKKRLNMKERARAVVNAIDAKITPLATMAGRTEYLTSRYLTLGRIAQTQQEARRVYDMFRKLSDADGQKVYAYLTDTEGTLEGVDALTKANATRVKKMIEQTGQMLVERGVIPQESFDKYQGRYLPRVYLAYLLGDKAVAAVGAGKTLSQQGYAKSRDETLPHEYRDLVLGEIKDPAFLASRALGIPLRDLAILNWLSKIAQNPDWVLPGQTVEWKMPGFDNVRTVTPYWLKSEATSLRERAQFYQGQNKADAMQLAAQMDEAADAALSEAGIALDQVPDGYKQVPNSARYGAVRGLIVVKDIYDDIVGVGRVVSNDASLAENILGYGGIGSKITGYWKWAKVAANPPAQIRNVISNMVLLQLSGVPMHKLPGLIARAAKEVRTKGKFYQVGLKYGVTESTFAAQEMQRIERETANYLARMGGRFSLAHLKDYFGRFQDWTGDMYQASEMLGKVVKIMDSMEREGKSEGEAAMAAQEWLFDYSLVGQNVRYLRSAPIGAPFLTFAIKVLPRILEVAITHPARFLPYAGMLYASSLLVQSLTGADDDDLDKLKKALPEWLQENGHVMMLPVKDEHGRWQFVDVGYFFPWTYWTGLASDLGGAVKDLVTKGETDKLGKAMTGSGLLGGPIPDMLTAIKTGKDSFTGRDIIDDHMTAGEKLSAMLTYLYGMAMPPFLTGIPPFHDHATSKGAAGHIYEALTGTTDKRGEPRSTVPQAMMRLVGVNVYGIEPEKARQRNILFKTYEISKTVQLMRSIAKDRSIDKDDKPELIAAYKTKINRMKEDLDTYKKESVVAPELR